MDYKDINTYDYELDESLIAQTPYKKRDEAKLLVVDKNNGNLIDDKFFNIINYLKKGDTLVLNNTKVMPCRIFGYKSDTKAKIEVFLLHELENDTWECLIKPQKRVHIGTIIIFSSSLSCEVKNILNDGITHVKFIYNGIFLEILDSIGLMPIPPYIHETLKNNEYYNTVYAKTLGSSAAPTAGLHFTKELLKKIEDFGVNILYVTLNVGLGTFRPVSEIDITKHDMHKEYYEISDDVANKLNECKKKKTRIICVGTTSLRTLESNFKNNNCFKGESKETGIFIYPPYKFESCDGLITNFHLPKSTLIMLVSAFSSVDIIKKSYAHAQKNKYKFFSFGDAMFITDDVKGVK